MMTGALESRAPSSAATTVDDEVQFWGWDQGFGGDENLTRGGQRRLLEAWSVETETHKGLQRETRRRKERFASGERRGGQRAFSSIISLVISSRVAAYRDSELQAGYNRVSMGFASA
jgi:hypothetical protein